MRPRPIVLSLTLAVAAALSACSHARTISAPSPAATDSASATAPATATMVDSSSPAATAQESQDTGGATPSESSSPATEPAVSPTPVPYSLVTPPPLPTAEPQPSASVNYLAFDRGALVRSWTAAANDAAPARLLTPEGWTPKDGAQPPYEFVIELPARTSIARFAIVVEQTPLLQAPDPSASQAAATPAMTVEFSTSPARADGPFTDAAKGSLTTPYPDEQTFSPLAAVDARFVKLRIDVPSGVTLTKIDRVEAFGTQAALAAVDLSGPWFRSSFGADSPWVDIARGNLLDSPDPGRLATAERDRWYAVPVGGYTQFAACIDGSESTVMPAFDDGSHRYIARRGDLPNVLVPVADGTAIVDSEQGYTANVFFRTKGAGRCAPLAAAGNGSHRVVVLMRSPTYYGAYVPPNDLATYPGYRFVPIFTPLFVPSDLDGAESIVFGSSCSIGLELVPAQVAAILDFVRTGHRLLIHDADTCRSPNYSFLPYPAALSAAGALGKPSNILDLAENDVLGTDRSDPKTFVDTNAFVAAPTQQIGDGDVIYSTDPHWCGHLLTTNAAGVSGYVQAYARFGRGLIVFDGLDHDNVAIPAYRQLLRLELSAALDGKLPCAHPLGGFLLVPPSTWHTYVPGRSQRIAIDLSAIAVLSFSGIVNLSVSGPYPATLSNANVTLDASRVPFGLLVDVPASARGRGHRFIVRGVDGAGHTSVAVIELIPGGVTPLERTLQETGRITLRNILFDTASAKLRPASYAVLGEIADALSRNPGWRLRIDGHTDNVGGAQYNLDLSQRRAVSVKTALVDTFHVNEGRLRTAGFGLTKPVASNQSASGRQLNRRVELVRV